MGSAFVGTRRRLVLAAGAYQDEQLDRIRVHFGNHATTGRWLVEEKRSVARVFRQLGYLRLGKQSTGRYTLTARY